MTGTVTDVLAPGLTYASIIKPSTPLPIVDNTSGQNVSIAIGTEAKPFSGGDTLDLVVIAKVNALAAGKVTPNSATITAPGADPATSGPENIQTPATTPHYSTNKWIRTNTPVFGTPVPFGLGIQQTQRLGNTPITSGTLVDTYPAGAVVTNADGGVVDTVNHTITWTFGALEPCTYDGCYVIVKYPSFTFPAADFVTDFAYTNTVTSDVVYGDDSTGTGTSAASVTFLQPKPQVDFYKSNQATIAPGDTIRWNLLLRNSGNVPLDHPVIVDTLPTTGVTGLKLVRSDWWSPNTAETTLIEAFVGGTWQTLATWIPNPAHFEDATGHDLGGYPELAIPTGATKVRLSADALPVEGDNAPNYLGMALVGTANGGIGTSIDNCATGATDQTDLKEQCVTTPVKEPFATVTPAKWHTFSDPTKTSTIPGETFTWGLGARFTSTSPVAKGDLVDILPKEFEYSDTFCGPVNGFSWGSSVAQDGPPSLALCNDTSTGPTPTVTHLPDGTTKLEWKDLDLNVPANTTYGSYWIFFHVTAKAGTAAGSYTNNGWADTPSWPTQCGADTGVADTGDIDGDGDTTEIVCKGSDTVIIDQAAIASISKWDLGTKENILEKTAQPSATCPDWDGFTRFPCVAQTDAGGTFQYRWTTQNQGNLTLTNQVIYDVLPYVGDTGVSQSLSGQNRGSKWVPTLSGPITTLGTVPTGANPVITYSKSSNPCRPELNAGGDDGSWQASCDDTWYTEAQIGTDWSSVKSFKILQFQDGASWLPGDAVSFQATMQAPLTAPDSSVSGTTINLSSAWNSVAQRVYRMNANGGTERLLASEPRKVGIIVPIKPAVSIGDYVWYDTNKDGLQSAGEAPASGVSVNLYNSTGVIVDTATTNANGYYSFVGLTPGGTYTVEFIKPDGYMWTTQDAGSKTDNNPTTDINDSDVAPATGKVTFTAPASGSNLPGGPTTATATTDNPGLDAGLIVRPKAVSIGDYVWYDLNRNGQQDEGEVPVVGMTVNLLDADGKPTGATTTTDASGYYFFKDLTPSTKYTVEFVKPTGTVFTSQTVGATVSDSNPDVTSGKADVTTPASGSNLTAAGMADDPTIDAGLIKLVSIGDYVWLDNNRDGQQTTGEPAVPGVTVNLLDKDGNKIDSTTTDAAGYYAFKDLLPETKYTVEFVKPDGTTFTTQNTGADVSDSDAEVTTGKADVITPLTGSNLTDPGKADDPTIDAGLVKYSLTLQKRLTTVGPLVPGSLVSYTLIPRNEGPAPALAGWSVTDVPPTGVTVYSIIGAGYSCDGTTLTCVASAGLAAQTNGGPILVLARIDAGFTGTAHNVAYVSPAPADGVETNPLVVPTKDITDTSATPTDNDAQADFVVPKVSIGDYVWWDTNRDGKQTAGEAPVANVVVNLYDVAGNKVADTVTDADGYYAFKDLAPATWYTVEFVKPDGSSFTTQTVGNILLNRAVDSNPDVSTGKAIVLTPISGLNKADPRMTDNPTIDAGLVKLNLVLEKSLTTEAPYYPGQTVTYQLTPSNEGPVDALKGWSVTDLLPTGVTIKTISGAGYACSADVPNNSGTCTADAALKAGAKGNVITVTAVIDARQSGVKHNVAYVSPSANEITEANVLAVPTRDTTDTAGTPTDNDAQADLDIKLVSIGDFVWWDVNRNGQQSAGEAPVENVVVNLYDDGGVKVADTKTDSNGYYAFKDLYANTLYTVEFVKPDGSTFTTQNTGADASDSDADLVTGKVLVTTPKTGTNLTEATKADDPTIDAGFVKINLVLAKSLDTAGPWVPDETVTYTLTPHNDGPVDALAGWSVTEVVPAQLDLVSLVGDGFTCDNETATCTATGSLAAGQDGNKITVTATIKHRNVIGIIHNVAFIAPVAGDTPETNLLVVPTTSTDTSTTGTDNDAQADLEVKPVSIGDFVWIDTNRDGLQTAGEAPIAGMTVNLYDAEIPGTVLATTTTDLTGYYAFTGLYPSTKYIVEFVKNANQSFTTQMVGADKAIDSNADLVTGKADVTTPATGNNSGLATMADDPTIDAGIVQLNLVISKALETKGPFHQGDTVTFTLVPGNEGPADALSGWSVTEVVPVGLTLVSMTGDGYTCADATCVAAAPLAAGAKGAPITMTATINSKALGWVHNVTYVSPSANEIVETNVLVIPTTDTDTSTTGTDNDAQASLKLVPPSIALKKIAHLDDFNGNGRADVGEVIHYSFKVRNTGGVVLAPVFIDDETLGLHHAACVDSLGVAETATCSTMGSHTVTADDVKDGMDLCNTATAIGHVPGTRDNVDSTDTQCVPIGRPVLPQTGSDLPLWALIVAPMTLVAGLVLLLVGARRRRQGL